MLCTHFEFLHASMWGIEGAGRDCCHLIFWESSGRGRGACGCGRRWGMRGDGRELWCSLFGKRRLCLQQNRAGATFVLLDCVQKPCQTLKSAQST